MTGVSFSLCYDSPEMANVSQIRQFHVVRELSKPQT